MSQLTLQPQQVVLKGGLEHTDHLKQFDAHHYIHTDQLLHYVFHYINLDTVTCREDMIEADLYMLLLPLIEDQETTTLLGSRAAHNLAVELADHTTSIIVFASDYYKKLIDAVMGNYFYLCNVLKVSTYDNLILIDLKERAHG